MSLEPPPPLQKPVPVRRKLLRSMFAAPVLTTVASGSALAQTSVTCVAKQTASPVFPAVTASTDHYVRIQLAKLQKDDDATKVEYYVSGASIQLLPVARVDAAYRSSMSGKWRLFKLVENTESSATDAWLTSQPAKSSWTYSPNSGQYAVLRFNSSGKIVGVGISTTSGTSAITGSCMTSIAA